MSRPGSRLPMGVLYALTLLAVFTFAVSSLTEFDFWWYLASGELILARHAVPSTDPFSYTAAGRPWINHMWASQVLLVAVWNSAGRVALIVGKGLIVTATFAVVLLTMHRRSVHLLVAAPVTLLAAWAGWHFWDVRPQIVTYLLLAVFLYILREGWETRLRTLVWLPLLVIPWANLHAGFVTGIAVIGLVGAGTALPRLIDHTRRIDGLRVLGLAAGLTVAAALGSVVNPFGLRAILFPLEVVNTPLFVASTTEWFSPNFHDPAYRGFEVMLVLLVPVFAWGRARLRTVDVLLILTFTHLGLTSARHVPLFAVAVAPILADALQRAGQELLAARAPGEAAVQRLRAAIPSLWPIVNRVETWAVVLEFAIVVGLVATWGSFVDPTRNPFFQDLNERRYPVDTVAFIRRERLPAPLFNSYAWAGYELWRLYPDYQVFIDGRTHVYGREILRDFLEVTTLGTRWREVLDRWRVQTILTARHSQLTQLLLALGGWRPVFAEREAVVFVRESPLNQAVLARLEPVEVWPTPTPVDRALAAALASAQVGNDEGAIRHYREVLSLAPDHAVALMSLAILREKRGETMEARRLLERILERHTEGELVTAARGRLERLR
jgi:tetratricopeptide (TPR) repeat protein